MGDDVWIMESWWQALVRIEATFAEMVTAVRALEEIPSDFPPNLPKFLEFVRQARLKINAHNQESSGIRRTLELIEESGSEIEAEWRLYWEEIEQELGKLSTEQWNELVDQAKAELRAMGVIDQYCMPSMVKVQMSKILVKNGVVLRECPEQTIPKGKIELEQRKRERAWLSSNPLNQPLNAEYESRLEILTGAQKSMLRERAQKSATADDWLPDNDKEREKMKLRIEMMRLLKRGEMIDVFR